MESSDNTPKINVEDIKHYLSNSKYTALCKCPRYYKNHYIRRLETTTFSPAMTRGNFVHKALEKFYLGEEVDIQKCWDEATEYLTGLPLLHSDIEMLDKIQSLGTAMIQGYMQYYENDLKHIEVIDVEKEYKYPVDTPYGPVMMNGKVDLVLYDNRADALCFWDHKTLSRVSSALVEKLQVDNQINLYNWLLRKHGFDPKIATYNVLGVSMIRHKKGQTKEAYIQELKARYLGGEYFSRLELFMTPDITNSFEDQVRDMAHHFMMMHKEGVFPRNSFACDLFGSCHFLTLCKEGDTAIDRGLYQVRPEQIKEKHDDSLT